MDAALVIILLVLGVGLIFVAAFLLDVPLLGGRFGGSNVKRNIRNIVASQRQATPTAAERRANKANLFDTAKDSSVDRVSSSRLTLRKRLKYAQWKMPIPIFWALVVGIGLVVCGFVSIKFDLPVQIVALFSGHLFMNWLLNLSIEKRMKAFDADYPQFLLSLVGLLKTGMNTMAAIDASAQSMEENSILRHEVTLMNERLRFGVSEDKSIGSFGEDIFHPEIELFVQALLLSRRVGGTLSDTLERLAKQVRKRQFFRSSAQAAVGMQRGSIWIIILILVGLELYLLIVYPEAVTGAWKNKIGWMVWQFGIMCVLGGIFWVRQVTRIKI